MTPLVDVAAVEQAAQTLRSIVVRTPLIPAPWLEELVGVPVRLKCENLQHAGAFKIRGAYNAMARLSEPERAPGVITYSSGNHGQAVALAARLFGVTAVVVMPTTAPRIKVEGAQRLGAEVVLEGTTSTDRHRKAMEIAQARGLTVIPPFDHLDIIAGQGTVGREILADWPEVQTILVPVGGGGLLSGISGFVKQSKPSCRVVGVEPEQADAMYRSRAAGQPVTIESRPTIADGLMPVRPGDLTFEHAQAFVDEIVRVSDDAIVDAARRLLTASKLVVEFSGAATVAALASGAFGPTGPTVAVLSGGNLDPVKAAELLDR
ncbi:MAG TPA: threonine/serine dehydratase [Longimicrobiales bacterium]|nr:threonine/serine dehydratase [Longimicrobiales bacterium]